MGGIPIYETINTSGLSDEFSKLGDIINDWKKREKLKQDVSKSVGFKVNEDKLIEHLKINAAFNYQKKQWDQENEDRKREDGDDPQNYISYPDDWKFFGRMTDKEFRDLWSKWNAFKIDTKDTILTQANTLCYRDACAIIIQDEKVSNEGKPYERRERKDTDKIVFLSRAKDW